MKTCSNTFFFGTSYPKKYELTYLFIDTKQAIGTYCHTKQKVSALRPFLSTLISSSCFYLALSQQISSYLRHELRERTTTSEKKKKKTHQRPHLGLKMTMGDQGPVLRNKDVESRTNLYSYTNMCMRVYIYNYYICYRLKIFLQYIILILSQTQSESFENNSMQPPLLNYLSSVRGSSRFREENFWVKKTKILWTTSHLQPSSQTQYLVGGFNPSENY